jgi:serine protease Do
MISSLRAALAASLVVVFVAAAHAEYSRKTPITEAVQKTRASIVAIRADKRNSSGGKRETIGTGVIVDERGYIVTSHHVVNTAYNVTLQLFDGTSLQAQIFAEDPAHDLAILAVRSSRKLKALPLGPGGDLMVGETVIAVGHPLGYTNTVSTGIISSLGREIKMPNDQLLSDLIQTNASINPGNSGGPLLNVNGELIGIIAAMRDGAQGIAFALNSETVKDVLARHLSARKIAGLDHGLKVQERVEEQGEHRQHVIVAAVDERGPAVGRVRSGDTILSVGDHDISNRFDVERALWQVPAGSRVSVKVLRGGKQITLDLLLDSDTRSARR